MSNNKNKDVFTKKEKDTINKKRKEMHDLIDNLWIDYINTLEDLRRGKTNQTK